MNMHRNMTCIKSFQPLSHFSDRNLVTTAKKMAVKIENFLDTHTVVTPVPRANDIHIMDTLKGISQSEVEQDESQSDLLVNYLCHTYSCLRNLKTPDLPSLINDLVIFIKENTYKGLLLQPIYMK